MLYSSAYGWQAKPTWAATTTCLRAVGQAREALKQLVVLLVRDCTGVERIMVDCMVSIIFPVSNREPRFGKARSRNLYLSRTR